MSYDSSLCKQPINYNTTTSQSLTTRTLLEFNSCEKPVDKVSLSSLETTELIQESNDLQERIDKIAREMDTRAGNFGYGLGVGIKRCYEDYSSTKAAKDNIRNSASSQSDEDYSKGKPYKRKELIDLSKNTKFLLREADFDLYRNVFSKQSLAKDFYSRKDRTPIEYLIENYFEGINYQKALDELLSIPDSNSLDSYPKSAIQYVLHVSPRQIDLVKKIMVKSSPENIQNALEYALSEKEFRNNKLKYYAYWSLILIPEGINPPRISWISDAELEKLIDTLKNV